MAKFIGIDALTTVAEKVGSQVVLGPAYVDPSLMQRLGIKVITGVQFKQTETLLVRKGGTTRRKVVGVENNNEIGFLKSRTLVAKLTWAHFTGNTSNFVETNFSAGANGAFPLTTAACEAILKTYAEDLLSNLFFGKIDNENVEGMESLSLYDGYHTLIAQDIADGYISTVNKNLIECDAITRPTDAHDSTPFDIVEEVYHKLSPALRQSQSILCYCSSETGAHIAAGYANKYHGNSKVLYSADSATFSVPELPRVTFVPTDVFGTGDRLVFTIPDNFQYGVDTLNDDTYVKVREGSDKDLSDIQFQIQSIQGCRILSPLASAIAVTTGSITENVIGGDYRNSLFVVTATEGGSVTVNGEAYDEPQEFAPNTVITLVATPVSGKKFVGWSNGKTESTINVIATGMPMAITAMFENA